MRFLAALEYRALLAFLGEAFQTPLYEVFRRAEIYCSFYPINYQLFTITLAFACEYFVNKSNRKQVISREKRHRTVILPRTCNLSFQTKEPSQSTENAFPPKQCFYPFACLFTRCFRFCSVVCYISVSLHSYKATWRGVLRLLQYRKRANNSNTYAPPFSCN